MREEALEDAGGQVLSVRTKRSDGGGEEREKKTERIGIRGTKQGQGFGGFKGKNAQVTLSQNTHDELPR